MIKGQPKHQKPNGGRIFLQVKIKSSSNHWPLRLFYASYPVRQDELPKSFAWFRARGGEQLVKGPFYTISNAKPPRLKGPNLCGCQKVKPT